MLPTSASLNTELEEKVYSARTYSVNLEKDRVDGYCTGEISLEQAIYFILHTERYAYPIYSWDYGIELRDLIGESPNFVEAMLPSRIREALMEDNRISDVTSFTFTWNKKKVHCQFVVISNTGNITQELEVSV